MPDRSESSRLVAVLGLGPMGSAIARVLATRGYEVTAWNRTPAKAAALKSSGVRAAESPAAAIYAGRCVIVSVADYHAASGLLELGEAAKAVAGRTVIQLTTGTPQEARAAAVWARAHDASYLDGAILVTPSQLGTPDAAMLVAGDSAIITSARPVLEALAPNLTDTGDEIGSAAAVDLAFLSHFFGGLLGFYHGARILEAEKIDVMTLGAMIRDVAPALGAIIHHDAGTIRENRFAEAESTLKNSATVVGLLLHHAREAGLDPTFPAFADALFQRGLAANFGAEDVAALVKVLRGYARNDAPSK